jgi:hypothetical protein
VLPGFVIVDLQRQERASIADESDWELVLRALSFSLLLHFVASPWTRALVLDLEGATPDKPGISCSSAWTEVGGWS